MMKIITIFALVFILIMPATAANVTKVEIHGAVFDEKSNTYKTLQWDAQNFTGFYYNFNGGKSSETLSITQSASSLTGSSRQIQQEKLLYNTSRTDQNFTMFTEKGIKVENGLDYNSTTKTFTKSATGGKYAQLGWFGVQYVAVNGKANKLAKLLINQGRGIEEQKTLKLGTIWELGEGYNLTVEALDTTSSPRQAHLSLSKDGKILDNKVVNEGDVYSYSVNNLKGESDVPVFVTNVVSIFAGSEGMSTLVQLRYTWFISQNVLEVKAGDEFGVFEVKEANENYVLLYNKDKTVNLDQNTVQPLYGDIKFKVADNAALRFYPIAEKTAPGKYEVRGGAYDESKYKNLIWDAQKFPGFWYNFNGGKSSETLSITQSASSLTANSRTIQKENLFYNTSRTDQNFTMFTEKGIKVENGLDYNSTTKTFTKSATGGKYAQLGWFGVQYVAVNGKANKLAKLLINQGRGIEEQKTLKLGTIWELGEGYNLTVEALDTTSSPRQAHLSLSKDGKILDNKVVNEGDVYSYSVNNLKGESDVPVFVTNVVSIFAGAEGMSTLVQLRYTWFISQNVLEVKAGDEFGVFEVKEANENYVLLYNKDKTVNLDQNTVQPLYGDLKFRVADSSTALRFYPIIEQTIQAAPKAQLKAASATVTAIAPTATQTQAPPAPASIQAAALTAVQTSAPVPVETTTENTTVKKLLGFWGFYAVLGLSTVAYFVLRKKD